MENIYDYIIIGSGFGGSVSALRLAEKGYSVLVIEQGKHYSAKDFPRSNWNLRKYLWWPAIGFYGFQRLTFTRHANILTGTGVGGGSLVYANTLRIPPDAYFENPQLKPFGNWKEKLAPQYEKAGKMLGRTPFPHLNTEDITLRDVAETMGCGHTFESVQVGVYFGEKDQEKDPYFNGEGPLRKGCIECAGCMVGCRENAKNTLDKNYLWFAQKKGAKIAAQTRAVKLEHDGEFYTVHTQKLGSLKKQKTIYRGKGLVIAAGTLGTIDLLLKQKYKYKTLPTLSSKLGHSLRTNSETLSAISCNRIKMNNGVAITSSMQPDANTSVEVVKYPDRSGALKFFFNMSAGNGPGWVRLGKMAGNILLHPVAFVRTLLNYNWANNTVILLVMQTIDNSMKMVWKQGIWGGRSKLDNSENKKVPAYIESGQKVLHRYAAQTGGVAQNIILEVLFNVPTTAHILGGCPIGTDSHEGVIAENFEVHGYKNMFITDGSAIQGNLGVNPSFTISAQAEYAMTQIPEKS